MKLDIPKTLIEDVIEQLAETRDAQREAHNNTVGWDRSALGKLYSMLVQETCRTRATKKTTSVYNRRKASSRFKR